MADFLEEKKREIRERLAELKPLVDEYERLEVAAAALEGAAANGATKAASTSGRRRSSASSATPARRGRPRGSGTRSKQALELVRAQPGITIAELADAMKIKQNYLYRVLPALAKDGLVSKKGRGWFAKNGTTETAGPAATETSTAASPKAAKPKATSKARVRKS